MSAPPAGDLDRRIAELERAVQELHLRVVQLERLVGNVGEHSLDRSIIQERSRYDWQAPNRV